MTGDFGSQCKRTLDPLYIQLSRTVLHCCMSNGNFRKSIEQYRVACNLVEMMTVPSGDIDVKISFSWVPRIPESLSFAAKFYKDFFKNKKKL